MADYYQLLELEIYCEDKQVIKSAYKKLATRFHPDKNPDDKAAEEKFKEINEAYHTLIDDEKKRLYDLYLSFIYERKNASPFIPLKTNYNQFKRKGYQYYQYRHESRARYEREEALSQKKAIKFFLLILGGLFIIICCLLTWRHFLDVEEAKDYYTEGLKLVKSGNYSVAYNYFNKSIKLNDDEPGPYFAKAEIDMLVNKSYYEAYNSYSEAIRLSKKFDGLIYFKRAYCSYIMHNFVSAINDFDLLVKEKDFADEVYFFRASSYMHLQNQKQACFDWLKASELGFKQAEDSLKILCK